jgi:hypothetical protein
MSMKKLSRHDIAATEADRSARSETMGAYAAGCGVTYNTLAKALRGEPIQARKRDAIIARRNATSPVEPEPSPSGALPRSMDLATLSLEDLIGAITRKGFAISIRPKDV